MSNPEPIYPSRRAARKHKPLPRAVKAALRKKSAYRKIEKVLRKSANTV